MRNTVTLTVSQLNEYVKALLDSNELLNDVCIKGEISNFTNHYKSGHLYFSLKDAGGVVKAVMFRSSAVRLRFLPENGMKVLVSGRISAYPRDGVYQLYADDMQPDGVGSLYLAFEQLKEKLYAEGLFDDAHKKPIPPYPRSIGIITADTGAAVADMKNILTRRFPLAEIFIYPSLVQGAGAPNELCAGVRYFNRFRPVDVLIIGRGGGSMEDLWAFNSEALAREIFASNIPIISAVGHETDFTICDFVADLRAPTPSAAAELAVPERQVLLDTLAARENALRRILREKVALLRERLERAEKHAAFTDPSRYVERYRQRLNDYDEVLNEWINARIRDGRNALALRVQKLHALSPLGVLARGYALVTDTNEKAVSTVRDISVGEPLHIRLRDGEITAKVLEIQQKEIAEHGNQKENG